MRTRVLLISAVLFAVAATPASAATGRALPGWFTASLAERVQDAGAQGVRVGEERLNSECPGVQGPGVSAAGCIVAPAGCTANFIYTDGSSQYVGTARHCVDSVGQEVVMQVDTTTLASVGTVARMTSGEGEPGNDVAIIRIDPAVAAKWGVNPAVPVVGGPQGIYTGCAATPVVHYGHGYGVAVGPGKLEGGLATNWHDDGYGWTGFGAPGDSGSPVVTAGGQAAGNFTHLIVDTADYAGSTLAGMRITRILQTMGVRLVNADGSTTGAAGTSCG
jgi:S1-C subfamily serine protease